jgi:hypothetical protein
MLTFEIFASALAILLTPPVVWYTMQWLHDRRHGKRTEISAPSDREVQVAIRTALDRSARTYRMAERHTPTA